MTEPRRIVHKPRPDARLEDEVSALAAVYAFVLRAHQAKKKGAHPGTLNDDVRENQGAHTATESI